MSQIKIKRNFRTVTVAIGTATGTSTTLRMEDMAGAVVQLGTMSTNAATLQVWGNTTDTGAFAQLFGSDGTAGAITLAPSTTNSTVYNLPDAAYALPYVKLVAASAAATATAASVVMKS